MDFCFLLVCQVRRKANTWTGDIENGCPRREKNKKNFLQNRKKTEPENLKQNF